MKPIYRRALFVLAIAALPGIAAAEDAFTLHPTDIYAGPDSEYPPIAQLPPNTEVGVAGCLSDWSWCDVRFANDRGWVWAGDLGYPYEGRRVAIVEFGPRLHIPAVTFSINSYWDAHYRSRPFFHERQQWASRVHVEANRGGRPPHGGASVAERGGSSAQAPTAQAPQRERQQAQGTQQRPREEAAKRGENEQRAQGMQQRSREQAAQSSEKEQRAQSMPRDQRAAQSEQRQKAQESSRNQNQQAQSRSREEQQGKAQPAQPQAARTPPEQHAQQQAEQRPQQQGRTAQAPEREARANANANTPRGEAERGNAKGQQREQQKEEPKEGNQQQ